jgi:phosphoribosylformylglycinamidine (FGAM) synthase PurS component
LTKYSPEDLKGAYRDPDGRAIEGTVTSLEFQNLKYQGEVAGTVTFIVEFGKEDV